MGGWQNSPEGRTASRLFPPTSPPVPSPNGRHHHPDVAPERRGGSGPTLGVGWDMRVIRQAPSSLPEGAFHLFGLEEVRTGDAVELLDRYDFASSHHPHQGSMG